MTSSETFNSTEVIETSFEGQSDFDVGPTASIWNNEQSRYTLYLAYPEPPYPPSPNTFEPSKEVVHSGSQSAKLSLLNPITDRARRIHLEHNWDPIQDKNLWVECWYYLPVGFQVDDWTDLHRGLEERWGSNDKQWTEVPYYNWFQIPCGISRWSKVSDDEYKISSPINHGWADNNGDGVNDLPAEIEKYSMDTIKFGQWFKIKTHIYRDLQHGSYQMWLNDVLQWDLRDIRTIGILPERIASPLQNYRAWLSTGIALYSGDMPNVHPKFAYYDDFKAWSADVWDESLFSTMMILVTTVILGGILFLAVLVRLSNNGRRSHTRTFVREHIVPSEASTAARVNQDSQASSH